MNEMKLLLLRGFSYDMRTVDKTWYNLDYYEITSSSNRASHISVESYKNFLLINLGGKVMLTKIRKVKYMPEYKNPIYKVMLECPEGKELYVKFDYTHKMGKYMPLEVSYDGEQKGAKLAWYTNEIENLTVDCTHVVTESSQ